jgi:hypothetical protein
MTREDLLRHPLKLVHFTINGESGRGVVNDAKDGFQLWEMTAFTQAVTSYGRILKLTDEMIESMTNEGGKLELKYEGINPWVSRRSL